MNRPLPGREVGLRGAGRLVDSVRRLGWRTSLGPHVHRLRRSGPWRFAALVSQEVRRDELVERSAALAFITIVSLVPVLAAMSLVAGPSADEDSALFTLLSWLLPYTERTVVSQLREFVDQARAIRGVGIFAFLLTAIAAFLTVDRTINRIWKVGERRPFPARLRSFTLVLFWTPVMIGVTSSSLYVLGQRTASSAFGIQLLELVPFLVSMLGLTMLYWLVPFTDVALRFAAVGGAFAAMLLEGLRHGFSIYIELYNVTRIYGSFGLVILFLVSVQLGWLMVLVGSEVAYCVQNRRRLLRETAPARSCDTGWIAVAALLVIAERFGSGAPIVPRQLLAEELHLDLAAVDPVLAPLVEAGILVSSTDGTGFILAADPHRLSLEQVFTVYDRTTDAAGLGMSPALRGRLESLRGALAEARRQRLGDLVLAKAADLDTPPLAGAG